jgi:hypothetical protein
MREYCAQLSGLVPEPFHVRIQARSPYSIPHLMAFGNLNFVIYWHVCAVVMVSGQSTTFYVQSHDLMGVIITC